MKITFIRGEKCMCLLYLLYNAAASPLMGHQVWTRQLGHCQWSHQLQQSPLDIELNCMKCHPYTSTNKHHWPPYFDGKLWANWCILLLIIWSVGWGFPSSMMHVLKTDKRVQNNLELTSYVTNIIHYIILEYYRFELKYTLVAKYNEAISNVHCAQMGSPTVIMTVLSPT